MIPRSIIQIIDTFMFIDCYNQNDSNFPIFDERNNLTKPANNIMKLIHSSNAKTFKDLNELLIKDNIPNACKKLIEKYS
jgi:hypothetical protein